MRPTHYNPRYEVIAAWQVEFLPVNCSVIFVQPRGDEVHIIGSESFMFEQLSTAVSDVQNKLPWQASKHLVPYDDESFWVGAFRDLGLHHAAQVVERPLAITTVITQALLGRCWIDTEVRLWAEEGNNQLLIDSLNSYSVRERNEEEFTTIPLEWQYQQYLVRALERYAVWDRRKSRLQSRRPNYKQHDLAVI